MVTQTELTTIYILVAKEQNHLVHIADEVLVHSRWQNHMTTLP